MALETSERGLSTAAPALAPHCLTQDVDQRLEGYSGFNLLVGDLSTLELAYTSNRSPEGPRQLPPGLYGACRGVRFVVVAPTSSLAALVSCWLPCLMLALCMPPHLALPDLAWGPHDWPPGGPLPSAGVSNGLLGEWPKVARGTGILQGILAHHAQEQGTCSGTRPEEGGPGMAGSTEAGSTEAGSTESGGSAPQAPGSGPGDAAAAGASNGTSQQQLAGGGTGEQAGREQADATALGGGSGGACGPGAGAAGAAAGNAADAEHALPWDALFEKLMGDRVQHPDQPLTGWGRELDDLLSPIFVEQLVSSWLSNTRSSCIGCECAGIQRSIIHSGQRRPHAPCQDQRLQSACPSACCVES